MDSETVFKMADEGERNCLKRKRTHNRDLQFKKGKEKKMTHFEREIKEKRDKNIQIRLPKAAAEMSSNWRILQAVIKLSD